MARDKNQKTEFLLRVIHKNAFSYRIIVDANNIKKTLWRNDEAKVLSYP